MLVVLVGCALGGGDGLVVEDTGEGTEPTCELTLTHCDDEALECSTCATERAVSVNDTWYECSDGWRRDIVSADDLTFAAEELACHCLPSSCDTGDTGG